MRHEGEKKEVICKKCKIPLEMRGINAGGMFLDWWACPKCDIEPEKNERNDKTTQKRRALSDSSCGFS